MTLPSPAPVRLPLVLRPIRPPPAPLPPLPVGVVPALCEAPSLLCSWSTQTLPDHASCAFYYIDRFLSQMQHHINLPTSCYTKKHTYQIHPCAYDRFLFQHIQQIDFLFPQDKSICKKHPDRHGGTQAHRVAGCRLCAASPDCACLAWDFGCRASVCSHSSGTTHRLADSPQW